MQNFCFEGLHPLFFSNINIFKQGWFKSNYIDKKPEIFDNPVEFGFGGSQPQCEIPGCKNVDIIRCSWCQKSLCLKNLFLFYI